MVEMRTKMNEKELKDLILYLRANGHDKLANIFVDDLNEIRANKKPLDIMEEQARARGINFVGFEL